MFHFVSGIISRRHFWEFGSLLDPLPIPTGKVYPCGMSWRVFRKKTASLFIKKNWIDYIFTSPLLQGFGNTPKRWCNLYTLIDMYTVFTFKFGGRERWIPWVPSAAFRAFLVSNTSHPVAHPERIARCVWWVLVSDRSAFKGWIYEGLGCSGRLGSMGYFTDV